MKGASSDEKIPSSRRKTHPPTRKSHHLVGQRVLRREDPIISSDNASSDEKIPSSRRTTRPPTRRSHHVVGQCVLRREDPIISSEDACLSSKPCLFNDVADRA